MPKRLPDDFLPWLDTRLRDLDLNDQKLAIKAHIAPSVLSKARSGTQGIGWDAGVALARAINIPPEVMLRKLELLPMSSQGKHTALVDEILHIFPDLSEADQEEVLQIARLKLERRKRDNRGKKQGA